MKRFFLVMPAVIVFVSGALFNLSGIAHASTNKNNLIDDYIFDNTKSMTASQIDSWLNTFPSSCISPSSGFTTADPTGYSPNTNFVDGHYTYGSAVTAGKAIYDTAVAHGINPQVLLTKLQNEEQLVDGGSGCDMWRYTSAVGYACTDSGTNTHDYTYAFGVDPYASGAKSYYQLNDSSHFITPIYYKNGVAQTSITGSCVNTNVFAGFSEQIAHAAWALSIWRHKSEGITNWAAVGGDWNHCEDNSTCASNLNIPSSWACYSGLMTQGNFKRCPDDDSVFYDGYASIDGQTLHMDNGATAALYVYTPHIQSFTTIFSQFFGSPYSNCSYPVGANGVVYRVFNPNTNGVLLSSDANEICTATGKMGYIYDSALLYTSGTGSSPVYRLQKNGSYLYTISAAERDSAVNNYGYTLEGVAFSASPTLDNVNAPLPVYRLSYARTGQFFYTISSTEASDLSKNMDYKIDGVAFYSQNTSGDVYPNNIYRLAGPTGGYLYTPSSAESTIASNNYGYRYEGTAFQTRIGYTYDNLPVYRLAGAKGYFYTSSLAERKTAISLGYRPEGIIYFAYKWNDLSATKPIYRLSYKDGTYFYTSSSSEATSATGLGYKLEGVAFRVP
jgi:hypothetical protein